MNLLYNSPGDWELDTEDFDRTYPNLSPLEREQLLDRYRLKNYRSNPQLKRISFYGTLPKNPQQ